jgi:poly-gamma-glutamate synthesis protein (capsule biosynthesis protein)
MLKIALLGDIAAFGKYCAITNPNVKNELSDIKQFLSGYDIVLGNLETPFVDIDRPLGFKSAHISAHPGNIAILKWLGITHVSLANNHIADFGVPAYKRTKALLEEAGIEWFGAEGRHAEFVGGGEKIAFLGYCSYNTNPSRCKTDLGEVPNILDVESVLSDMAKYASLGYINILSVHSGQEHVHFPSSDDVFFARSLAAKYDYIYHGHHPHVVQGVEDIENSFLLYSLGNFLFDDVYTPRDAESPLIKLSEANKTGLVASITIKDGDIAEKKMLPIYLSSEKVLVGDEVSDFDIESYSEKLRNACSEAYDSHRRALIEEYIESRRRLRNFKWYWRRLNINSLGLIIASKKNAKRYKSTFLDKLSRLRVSS